MNSETSETEINRETKQKYLQVHILEKGLDSNEFLMFLTEVKKSDKAMDIDFWSLDELKKVY